MPTLKENVHKLGTFFHNALHADPSAQPFENMERPFPVKKFPLVIV